MTVKRLDYFQVQLNTYLSKDDYDTLNLLYLPIIGKTSFTVYTTLYSLISRSTDLTEKITHNTILDVLGIDINQFIIAKDKLEAVNLISTYQHENSYIYRLFTPNSPEVFKSSILGEYLVKKMGHELFELVMKKFTYVEKESHYQNISKTFDQVFEFKSSGSEIKLKDKLLDKVHQTSLEVNSTNFNYDLFLSFIKAQYKDIRLNRPSIKKQLIAKSYTYSLSEEDMHYVYMSCIKDDKFDIKLLDNAVKNYVKQHNTKNAKPKVKEEIQMSENKLENFLSNTTPKYILSKSNSIPVADSDLRAVDYVYNKYDLKSSVINVIVYYIVNTPNLSFSQALLDKIAYQYQSNNIDNVAKALEYNKNRSAGYKKSNSQSAASTKNINTYKKKSNKTNVNNPDWVNDYDF